MTTFPYEIPANLMSAWVEGKLKIVGATLRWVDGNLVAGHMAPVSEAAAESMSTTLGNLPGAMAALTPALQVINLGVNVAGFAYMAVKMEGLSRQITALSRQINFVATDVQTIRQINETSMTAALIGGVEEAARGERLHDVPMLHAARRELNRGFVHHLSMIPAMVQDGNAADQLAAVEVHLQRAVLLATTVARCDWLAEGPRESADWLIVADKRLRGVVNELQDSYRKNPDYIDRLTKDKAPIKEFFDRARGLLGVLESHAAQTAHAARLGLAAPADWDAYLLEEAKNGEVLFLPPVSHRLP